MRFSPHSTSTLRSGVVAAAVGALVLTGVPAYGTVGTAEDDTDPDVVASVIAEAAPDELATIAPEELDDGFVAETETGLVVVPDDADGAITIFDGEAGEAFDIGLPDLAASDDPVVAEDGTIVYPSAENVEVGVQIHDNGVRILTVIEDASADEAFDYPIGVPENGSLEIGDDGSVLVFDGDGEVIALIDAPWATDAEGKAVPTHFELRGATLTQVVNHKDASYSYPIVADPSAWQIAKCAAAVGWVIASTVFAVAKIAKIKSLIRAAGGTVATARKVITALRAPGSMSARAKAGFAALGSGAVAIAVEVLGIATIQTHCTFK